MKGTTYVKIIIYEVPRNFLSTRSHLYFFLTKNHCTLIDWSRRLTITFWHCVIYTAFYETTFYIYTDSLLRTCWYCITCVITSLSILARSNNYTPLRDSARARGTYRRCEIIFNGVSRFCSLLLLCDCCGEKKRRKKKEKEKKEKKRNEKMEREEKEYYWRNSASQIGVCAAPSVRQIIASCRPCRLGFNNRVDKEPRKKGGGWMLCRVSLWIEWG